MGSVETSTNHITGTTGADSVAGTEQNDSFIGTAGDDKFVGGLGDDYSEGGDGQDTLIGDLPSAVEFDPKVITIVEDYTMKLTFEYEGAGYKNSLGAYKIDPETGAISDVSMMWENASLAGSGGDLIGGESSVDIDVSAGEQIGFFIIGDGYNQNNFEGLGEGTLEFVNGDGSQASTESAAPTLRHVATDGTITLLQGHIYHSTSTAPAHELNSDGMDHTAAHSAGDSTTFTIGFEDIHGGGDMDFDDTVFSVEVGAANGAAIMGELDDGTSGGDDRLEGRDGEDQIEGNSGDDLLVGGGAGSEWQLVDGKWVFNPDALSADAGHVAEGDDDTIIGGSGEDVLIGNGGNDVMYGGAGFDRFNGGTGDDTAYGGSGDDKINLQSGDDYAVGGAGADTVNAGSGNDLVYGDEVGENMLRTTGEETSFNDFATMEAWDKYSDEETGMSTIVQEIETEAGEPYELTVDVAANLAAGVTSGTIEVLYNGTVIETIDATSGVFESHTISFEGAGGLGSLSFRNVETSAEAASNAPVYDTTGPIFTYDSTLSVGGADVDVAAFAPGQSNLYQVIDDQFKVFNTEVGEYQDVGAPFGFKANAIGFNVENDLIYGIARGKGTDSQGNAVSKKDLVAVDAEGNTYRIGDTPVNDYVGDFDDAGNLWTFQSSVNRITKIDVDNLDADGDPVVENYYLPGNLFGGNTYDVAYSAADNAFYAVQAPSSNGGNGKITKIDVSEFDGTNNPVITSVKVSGTLVDGVMEGGMAKGSYGAVFMDGTGTLYAGLNKGDHDLDGSTGSSGGVYKYEIDWESGQAYAELLSESESTGSNDGASDPRALDPFAEQDTDNTVLIKAPELIPVTGGNDALRGGKGEDEIHAGAGDDRAHGGDDNDLIYGDAGNDKLSGNAGDDTVHGGTGDDNVRGHDGADVLAGDTGNDSLYGGSGEDTVDGGYGDDLVRAGSDNDEVSGGRGDDRIYGNSGNDQLFGESGADTLVGGSGDDSADGGSGDDLLNGQGGNDNLFGGSGTDKIVGGSGSDTLEGGGGTDHLWGGNWAGDNATDTFAYSKGGGKDIIHDFESDQDQIDLSAYDLSYEDIQDRMIDRGWALEINLEGIDKSGAGDKILLKSVKADDLDSDNFII